MKTFNAIDITRVIAAILVICVHTDPLYHYSEASNYFIVSVLARLAVPFFFVTSGFFFGKKISLEKKQFEDLPKLLSMLKRLATLYFIWSIMYLPLQFYSWLNSNRNMGYWLTYLQKAIFEGSYYTLWYLVGLIVALFVSYLLFKLFKPRLVLLLSFILFVIGTLFQSYYEVWSQMAWFDWYYNFFLTTRNGLFFGTFFVSLGIFLAHTRRNFTLQANITLFVVTFLLLTFEAFNMMNSEFPKGSGMWIMLGPTVLFLFLGLKRLRLPTKHYYKYTRPISFLMYVSHGLFMIVFSHIFEINSLLYFLVILLLTAVFSVLIVVLSKKYPILYKLY